MDQLPCGTGRRSSGRSVKGNAESQKGEKGGTEDKGERLYKKKRELERVIPVNDGDMIQVREKGQVEGGEDESKRKKKRREGEEKEATG